MGMFDDLKKRMDKFGKDVEKSLGGAKKGPGHTLGASKEDARDYAFDPSKPLGMTLTKRDDGRAGVTAVTPGGQASQKGVAAGDVVAALNGTDADYDAFMALFAAARSRGGPARVRFGRALPRGAAKPVSTGERDARRDAALRAAEARDAAAGRKGPKGGRAREDKPVPVREDKPRSAATQAAWDAAARGDDRTKRELGYDPFRAVSTAGTLDADRRAQPPAEPFAGGGRRLDGRVDDGAATPPPPSAPSEADAAAAYEIAEAEAAVAIEALEAASTEDAAAGKTCLETLAKLLANAAKPEAKFRRVRLGNAAIRQRVLAVEGGLELLCAAGFALAEEGGETVLALPEAHDRARRRAATDAVAAARGRLGDAP